MPTVTVTAQKEPADKQKTPLSVTAVSKRLYQNPSAERDGLSPERIGKHYGVNRYQCGNPNIRQLNQIALLPRQHHALRSAAWITSSDWKRDRNYPRRPPCR